ncbi:MAG: pyridoxamine 5'-phosphate oxidase family protein [Methanomassiliicoccaceae archaeon]|jgi:predicted pyridoxine 5'-phosphate oxidase superfamily flavin-nucleotide-binding protein|nr:pyridoxamine 5'-phosphate oxidase family protein [Methanomassiliicoccaceae archaeon]
MVKLTEQMINDLKKITVLPLATASASGAPNVVPIATKMMVLQSDNETVWMIDNFMQKTLENMKANPRASIYVWSPETSSSYQFKGDVQVETDGADYEKAKAHAKSIKPDAPAKSLVKFRITEVYSVAPGATAGKRLL